MDGRQLHDRRWWILGALVAGSLPVVADSTVVPVALPAIQRALGAGQRELEWVVVAYALIVGCLLSVAGRLGDSYGHRRLLVAGLVVFGLGSLLAVLAGSVPALIVARAVAAMGAAAIIASTLSIITAIFTVAERPRAIGIWAGFSGLGVALGPLLVGVLLSHAWWGSAFAVSLPLVLPAAIVVWWLAPESRVRRPKPRQALWDRLSVAIWAVLAAVFFGTAWSLLVLSFYLQAVRAHTPAGAALRLLPLAVAVIAVAPSSVVLSRGHGARTVVGGGLGLIAAAFVAYLLVTPHSSGWALELVLVGQGVGIALAMAPAAAGLTALTPRRAHTSSAVSNGVRQIGAAVGVAVLGAVFSASYHSNEPAAFTHALHVSALAAAAVTALVAVIAVGWLPRRSRV